MADVTRAEFEELRTMVEKTYFYARRAGLALTNEEKREEFAKAIDDWCDPVERRLREGTPIYVLGAVSLRQWAAFERADLLTIEEMLLRPRGEVASIEGVGRATMRKIDAALAKRDLTWAEAV